MQYNHAIDMAFEYVCDTNDPITPAHLPGLLAAARKRLDRIEERGELEAFGAFDTFTDSQTPGGRQEP